MTPDDRDTPLRLSADIVAAYLTNNPAGMEVIPDLIRNVHSALARLGEPEAQVQEPKSANRRCRSAARCSMTTSSASRTENSSRC